MCIQILETSRSLLTASEKGGIAGAFIVGEEEPRPFIRLKSWLDVDTK